MTMVSRISGLARDMVFAYIFRVGGATDAFFIAFKIPNFLRRLFAEGAFSQAFVPVLSEYKIQKSEEDVADLIRHVAGTLGVLLSVLTIIVVVATPIFVMLIAWGYIGDEAKIDLTARMLRITFPYIFFISLTALVSSVLNTYGRFAIPAFTPVLLNVSLISAALFLSPYFAEPVMALAWGVFIAGIAQLSFQLPALARLGLLRWPGWNLHHTGVRKIMRLMLPGIIGSSAMQINLLFDIMIASFLVEGSITWLYYSDRMMEFPLGVFGVALATVILPNLSEKHAREEPEGFTHMLDWGIRMVLLIGVPAAVGLGVLAKPILVTLFYRGEFTAVDVQMASYSLYAYALGLLGFMLIKVLVPGYFARQDTKTPMRVGLIAMLVNMVFNVILVFSLLEVNFQGAHMGLAAATTISSFINALLLWRGLRKKKIYQPAAGWGKLLLQIGLAGGSMGGFLWWLVDHVDIWLEASSLWRISHLSGIVLAGGVVYFVVLWLLGARTHQFRRP
jgi:putative peptidoglycan lipid II flippase